MSAPEPPAGDSNPREGTDAGGGDPFAGISAENRERASQALRDAFTRLAPQGSDEWNFSAAFTLLGDRYGPYHPGASTLSDALAPRGRATTARPGRLDRLRAGMGRGERAAAEGDTSEFEDAMGHIVEAFRFLSARVATLEARVAAQDSPVDGVAWLAPARELDGWVDPVASHVLAHTPGGEIVHADCGEGSLLRALTAGGATAHGVEPRGSIALRALEGGNAVTIAEASEYLGRCPAGSLGGVVLNGVVDRLPLHELLPLLVSCRTALARRAPVVIVSEPATGPRDTNDDAADDLLDGRSLHAATWELVLDRIGFVEVAHLTAGGGQDRRFALSASTPS